MTAREYAGYEALDPFFDVIERGLAGLAEGDHFFDLISEEAVFEFRYRFPGWPSVVRGRSGVMEAFSGYGTNIELHSADALAVHRSTTPGVVTLEYEVHGKHVGTGAAYDNRFASIVTVRDGKIVLWRDYMDSLAAWSLLRGARA